MRLNKELDYDAIYNGRGVEIGEILVDYFDEKMKLVKKEAILPDRPDRNNEVGLKLTFKLKDKLKIICAVDRGVGFSIGNVNSVPNDLDGVLTEIDYMTFDKMEQQGFSLSDEVVYEKLAMLKHTLDTIRNGDEIVRFDVEK